MLGMYICLQNIGIENSEIMKTMKLIMHY